VSISKQYLTHEYIIHSKLFPISVLAEETLLTFIAPCGFWRGRDIDKFKDVKYKIGKTGMPVVLDCTNAYLEVEVEQAVDVDTHTLFIGKVVEAEVLNDKKCLTYSLYREVRKGKTPDKAPTYAPKSAPTYQEVKDG